MRCRRRANGQFGQSVAQLETLACALPAPVRCFDLRADSVGLSNPRFPLGKDHRGSLSMMTATDEFPDLIRAGELTDASDAGLFALVDELKEREKDRNDLLDRLSIEEGDQIEAAAKKACDAARAIYERIAAMKPTTAAGVLCQLELAASGWIAPSTMPIAMAGLREIAHRENAHREIALRPPPLKVGRLPPVPPRPASQVSLTSGR
jgi:hypothetical protein